MTYCRYASVTPVTVYIAAAIRGYATGCRMTVIHCQRLLPRCQQAATSGGISRYEAVALLAIP